MNLSLATQNGKENVFYIILTLFVLVASIATGYEFYYLWALPAAVMVIGLALFKLDWLLLAISIFPLPPNPPQPRDSKLSFLKR